MSRKKRTMRFHNRFGLHMQPASEIARIAYSFEAEITVSAADNQADARSIFELLILGIRHGEVIELSAIGQDAEAALDVLCAFLDSYRNHDIPDAHRGGGLDSFAA